MHTQRSAYIVLTSLLLAGCVKNEPSVLSQDVSYQDLAARVAEVRGSHTVSPSQRGTCTYIATYADKPLGLGILPQHQGFTLCADNLYLRFEPDGSTRVTMCNQPYTQEGLNSCFAGGSSSSFRSGKDVSFAHQFADIVLRAMTAPSSLSVSDYNQARAAVGTALTQRTAYQPNK